MTEVAFVPASLAKALVRIGELPIRQPPYRSGTSTTRAVWHQRNEHDVAHAWLREQVAQAARGAAGGAEE
ncbi:hypothetical protein [Ramlibacter sp. AN1133]|uniref:hypothetical protein n=1 Tax=Ramlibacter sp. AN1133 TaxID=3133429 RepID=UPI0030BBEA55